MEKKTEYQKLVVTGINIITTELHLWMDNNPNIGPAEKSVMNIMNDAFDKMCEDFCCGDEA